MCFCFRSLSTTFRRRQQTVYSSNTYIYSRATSILGLWPGVLERHSSQAPKPLSVPGVIPSAAQDCSVFCGLVDLLQSAAQSQTMWAVVRPVRAITEDIFIRTVRPRPLLTVLRAPHRNIYTYLLNLLIYIDTRAFVTVFC